MKPRVLIVEDEKDMRETIAEVIGADYEPLMAETGQRAIEIIKSEGIDLILLDLRLPDINGMEVLAEAKKHDSNIEVIIVTAYPDVRGAVEATKLGAYDYIPKPFHNDDLLHTIHRAYANLVNHREIERLRAIVENTLNKILEKEKKYAPLLQSAKYSGKVIPLEEIEELWDILLAYKEELTMVKEGFERRETVFAKFKPIVRRSGQMVEGKLEDLR